MRKIGMALTLLLASPPPRARFPRMKTRKRHTAARPSTNHFRFGRAVDVSSVKADMAFPCSAKAISLASTAQAELHGAKYTETWEKTLWIANEELRPAEAEGEGIDGGTGAERSAAEALQRPP